MNQKITHYAAVETRPLPMPADIGVVRINGEWQVLLPGLIDVHTHLLMEASGHSDFRELSELPHRPTSELSLAEKFEVGAIADGVDKVRRRTREQLILGGQPD